MLYGSSSRRLFLQPCALAADMTAAKGGGCHGTNVSNPELTVEPGARQTQEALVHFGQESEIVSAKP